MAYLIYFFICLHDPGLIWGQLAVASASFVRLWLDQFGIRSTR
jgi:hypothetical protein